MFLETLNVAELLPISGPAILLDKIVSENEKGVTTRVGEITSAHPYYSIELHGVPSWVGIEFMAQSIGLHAGLSARRENRPPRVGYLLGTRRYVPRVPVFEQGLELMISAEQLYSDVTGLGAYACTIEGSGRTLAAATIIVFQGKAGADA
jgi:predicted hotdog family 3-hydroxylacyl-ACP dehydratase